MPVARLGLASHLQTSMPPDDVLHAIDRGVTFLNWLRLAEDRGAEPDVFAQAIASLGSRRDEVVVCVQFGPRTSADAHSELESLLDVLRTDYVDVLTFY
ncbi:MAG: hypothetical protein HUU20_04600 [Pirellulales bacterium]|nr:hypothetical protein [Pirellulales bacterium]